MAWRVERGKERVRVANTHRYRFLVGVEKDRELVRSDGQSGSLLSGKKTSTLSWKIHKNSTYTEIDDVGDTVVT